MEERTDELIVLSDDSEEANDDTKEDTKDEDEDDDEEIDDNDTWTGTEDDDMEGVDNDSGNVDEEIWGNCEDKSALVDVETAVLDNCSTDEVENGRSDPA